MGQRTYLQQFVHFFYAMVLFAVCYSQEALLHCRVVQQTVDGTRK